MAQSVALPCVGLFSSFGVACLRRSYNGVSTFLNHNKWCARDRREFSRNLHKRQKYLDGWKEVFMNCNIFRHDFKSVYGFTSRHVWKVLLMVSGLSVLLTVHFTQMAFSSSFTGVVTADNANYSKIFLSKIEKFSRRFQRLKDEKVEASLALTKQQVSFWSFWARSKERSVAQIWHFLNMNFGISAKSPWNSRTYWISHFFNLWSTSHQHSLNRAAHIVESWNPGLEV